MGECERGMKAVAGIILILLGLLTIRVTIGKMEWEGCGVDSFSAVVLSLQSFGSRPSVSDCLAYMAGAKAAEAEVAKAKAEAENNALNDRIARGEEPSLDGSRIPPPSTTWTPDD